MLFGQIERAIDRLVLRMHRPEALSVTPLYTRLSMLCYRVTSAPCTDPVVARRVLSVAVNGTAAGPAAEFPREATDYGVIFVPADASIVLTLVDFDASGNASAPAVLEFVATNKFPPATPTGLAVEQVPAPA